MRLVATSGDQVLSFPLRQGSTLIGRHPSCHVCIPAKGLSRRHCQVYVDGATVVLRDLGSSNGTFVNNRRVERTELQDGDVISLGGFTLRYDAEGSAAPPGGGYAQGAEATEEVLVAETTDAEPGGEAEPFAPPPPTGPEAEARGGAEEGVPPPTDYPEQPAGDETPVDNAFVPAPYTGQQSFGVAQQPQLVVRD
ncbi:MAG: FHA domain-containing protein, partial [bacterium]